MEKGFISLVFFTVLCQSAVGLFIIRELMLVFTPGNFTGDKILRINTLTATETILLLALIIAFFHLGKPLSAVHTLNNLKSSWLSREILFVIIFSAVILAYMAAEKFMQPGNARYLFSAAGIIAGAGLIISMTGIYMLRAVPAWNSLFTPAGFILTAATMGTYYLWQSHWPQFPVFIH